MSKPAPNSNSRNTSVADRLLQTDPRLRLLSKQILRTQNRLRREVSAEGWNIYLRLEELVDKRCSELLDRIRARRNG